ncbi:MAG: aspartate/glutamate racemase family protein, partial [Alphaproteobacteria bacterium]|nr:aspartate/glutamate racemase family protein [Alphaproteobacteria bacterium]
MTAPLGILMLDTGFPRPVGDLGNPASYPFPVVIRRVAGATPSNAVHAPDPATIATFIAEGRALVAAGCVGVITTCGFLARWQREIAAGIGAPFAASSLIAYPTLRRLLPPNRLLGVVTYSAPALDQAVLTGAGIDDLPPIEGIDPASHFARVIGEKDPVLDPARMAADVLTAARRLVARAPAIGGLLLECANMPPYAELLRREIGLPVFDPLSLAIGF